VHSPGPATRASLEARLTALEAEVAALRRDLDAFSEQPD